MSDSFTQFQSAYLAADQNIKDFIDSEQVGIFAQSVMTNPDDISLKRKIIVCLSNRILNITTDSELVDELEKLGIEAESIAKAKAFVDQKTTPSSAPSQSVQADLAEIEKAMHQINPVRTMATDGKQVGYSSIAEDTYSSSQSSIIDEDKQ